MYGSRNEEPHYSRSDGIELAWKCSRKGLLLVRSHGGSPGREIDYHTASRRQYVITLSGHAELVLSGGQTIQVGPGSIELAEDLTGKGHITRTVGTEDRVVIVIPISGPSPSASQ